MKYPDKIPHDWRCPHTGAAIRPLTCDDCTADDVYRLYSRVNNGYRKGKPLIADTRWDIIETLWRWRFPDDERFWSVGETK